MRIVKLQATIEELMAMNEQLKASNVELQQKITERERLQDEFNQFFDRSLDVFGIVGFDGSIKRIFNIFTG